jgi:hypothetical protein
MKLLVPVLAFALVTQLMCLAPAIAQTQVAKDEIHARKLRGRASTFQESAKRVNVKLRDGDKITGYVTEVTDKYFVVSDNKGAHPVVVQYENVRDFGASEKLGPAAKYGLVFGAALGAILGICAATQRCQN